MWLTNFIEEIEDWLSRRDREKLERMKLRDEIETTRTDIAVQKLSQQTALRNARAELIKVKSGGAGNATTRT
jgi:hypothetical protein